MNALTRWDSFKEMDDLQPRLESSGLAQASTHTCPQKLTAITLSLPARDISQENRGWRLKVYFPKAKAQKVTVTVLQPF